MISALTSAAMNCSEGMVYLQCGPACPPTCDDDGSQCPSSECVEGCFCPNGTVLLNGLCVNESDCQGIKSYTMYNVVNPFTFLTVVPK